MPEPTNHTQNKRGKSGKNKLGTIGDRRTGATIIPRGNNGTVAENVLEGKSEPESGTKKKRRRGLKMTENV